MDIILSNGEKQFEICKRERAIALKHMYALSQSKRGITKHDIEKMQSLSFERDFIFGNGYTMKVSHLNDVNHCLICIYPNEYSDVVNIILDKNDLGKLISLLQLHHDKI